MDLMTKYNQSQNNTIEDNTIEDTQKDKNDIVTNESKVSEETSTNLMDKYINNQADEIKVDSDINLMDKYLPVKEVTETSTDGSKVEPTQMGLGTLKKANDIFRGIPEFVGQMAAGATAFIPSYLAQFGTIGSLKIQNALEELSKDTIIESPIKLIKQAQEKLGIKTPKTPEEQALMGERVANYIHTYGGFLPEPKTKFAQKGLEAAGKVFSLVPSGLHKVIDPFIDKEKHPNANAFLVATAELGVYHYGGKAGIKTAGKLFEKAKTLTGNKKKRVLKKAQKTLDESMNDLEEYLKTSEGKEQSQTINSLKEKKLDSSDPGEFRREETVTRTNKEAKEGVTRQQSIQEQLDKQRRESKNKEAVKSSIIKETNEPILDIDLIEKEYGKNPKATSLYKRMLRDGISKEDMNLLGLTELLLNKKQKRINLKEVIKSLEGKKLKIKKDVTTSGTIAPEVGTNYTETKYTTGKDNTTFAESRVYDKALKIKDKVKNTIHIEELQSKAHDKAKVKGYENFNDIYTKDKLKLLEEEYLKAEGDFQKQTLIFQEMNKLKTSLDKVPDMPFKKDWHKVVLRDTLIKAIKEGKDGISWETANNIKKKYPGKTNFESLYDKQVKNFLENELKGKVETITDAQGKQQYYLKINKKMKRFFKGKTYNALNTLLAPLKNQTGAITINFEPKQVKALKVIKKEARKGNLTVPEYLISKGMEYEKAYKVEELIDTHKAVKVKKEKKPKKKSFIQDVIEPGVRQLWDNPNYESYYNFLVNEGRMINPYTGNGIAPDFVRPMIGKEYPKLKETYTDQKWYHEGQSPHQQFDYAYNLENNPSYDFMESYMAYHQNIGNQGKWAKDVIDRTWTKESRTALDKALDPIRNKVERKMTDTFASQERVKLREQKIKRMREGKNKEKLKEINKKEKERIGGALKDISLKMDKHLENVLPKLAKQHSSIRIMLEAEGRLPEKIKLTSEEKVIIKEIKEFFEKSKQELIRNDIPVKDGDYTPNLWKAAIDSKTTLLDTLGMQSKKLPTVLKFQHRTPNSRSWYPDMKTILDSYIPIVNKKIAYQPFLDRWRDPMVDMPPKLKSYYTDWLNKNMKTEQLSSLGKAGNAALAFEYFRTIGFSVSVAFKHLLKSPHTITEVGPVEAFKTLPKAVKVSIDAARTRLKWEKSPALESRLVGSFYNMKSIIETLEGAGLESASHMLKTIPGSMTTFIEFMENGVNVLATVEAGMKKGIKPSIIQKRIWESILDANFRLGPDEFVWRKNNTGARMATLYFNTPAKMLEHQAKLIRKALSREVDNFGTSYGKKAMYMIASIGMAEAIAQANDTTILHSLVHIPSPHTMVDTVTDFGKALSHPQDIEVKKSLQRTFPQLNKIYNTVKGDYYKKYYNNPLQSLLGIKKNHIKKNSGKSRNYRSSKGGRPNRR